MRATWFGGILCLGSLLSCAQDPDTRCGQLAQEVRDRLAACEIEFYEYDDESNEQCTASLEAKYECLRDCYNQASCEAIEYHDPQSTIALHSCAYTCLAQADS